MWMLVLPLVVIVAVMIYTYVILPRITQNHEEQLRLLAEEFSRAIKGRESEEKQLFIKESPFVAPFASEIKETDIKGIINCQQKRETKDFIRQQTKAFFSKTMRRLYEVDIREIDNDEFYFLVLTTNHLYYLHYSIGGHCKEHIQFDCNHLEAIETGNPTAKEITVNSAYASSERLSFVSDGIKFKFFIHDSFNGFPAYNDPKLEDLAQLDVLFKRPFKQELSKLLR